MIEVSVPKDVFKRTNKVMGAFSARNLIFAMLGAIAAIISYQFLKWIPGSLIEIVISAVIFLIFGLLGFVNIQNEPIYKILPRIIGDNFISPTKRYKEIKFEDTQNKRPVITSVKGSKTYRKVK